MASLVLGSRSTHYLGFARTLSYFPTSNVQHFLYSINHAAVTLEEDMVSLVHQFRCQLLLQPTLRVCLARILLPPTALSFRFRTVPAHTLGMTTNNRSAYVSCFLTLGHGYPLWLPEPNQSQPLANRKRGVSIGDVGMFTPHGGFDFLFNICAPVGDPNNFNGVPQDFNRLQLDEAEVVRDAAWKLPETVITSTECSALSSDSPARSKGALLVLPQGASREDVADVPKLRYFATVNALAWYEFTRGPCGREAEDGSLYLVTGCDKANSWKLAFFSQPPDDGLNEEDAMQTRCGPTPPSDTNNQCLFIRALTVRLHSEDEAIRGDIVAAESLCGSTTGMRSPYTMSGSPDSYLSLTPLTSSAMPTTICTTLTSTLPGIGALGILDFRKTILSWVETSVVRRKSPHIESLYQFFESLYDEFSRPGFCANHVKKTSTLICEQMRISETFQEKSLGKWSSHEMAPAFDGILRNNLAIHLSLPFCHLGQITDLDRIVQGCETLRLWPPSDPCQAISHNDLANALGKQFHKIGQLGDQEEAIVLSGETNEPQSPLNLNCSALVETLANLISMSFGQLAHFEEAILLRHEALGLQPLPDLN